MKTVTPIDLPTKSGIVIRKTVEAIPPEAALSEALSRIDRHRGGIFSSGYEFPGRYSRWELGFTDPPLELLSFGRRFELRALNERGSRLLILLVPEISSCESITVQHRDELRIDGTIDAGSESFAEEHRSQQPTLFTLLRTLCTALRTGNDRHLGFYGACGHDLVLQFESIQLRHTRPSDRPDLHLFLPDQLVVVDRQKETAMRLSYDFSRKGVSTIGLPRVSASCSRPSPIKESSIPPNPEPGAFAKMVDAVRDGFFRGDYFELTLSQTLNRPFKGSARQLFSRIQASNPSPYEFLLNFGDEQLVGASPEMFVRVEGRRVETCPIAGTAARPASLMDEADVIRELLSSNKDESELTMCSDVDRNDKARVCEPGTVRVIGRRQIETYSRLFHTVDHIEGILRQDCDGFDALLSHMWACTLTGAPKPAAIQVIEDIESSPREWYGGCVGMFLTSGEINTGITIRTVHLKDGYARVRVGATLLADSNSEAEEKETQVKASAFLDALVSGNLPSPEPSSFRSKPANSGSGKHVLFVDHRDSFVHTLADYVRQTGAEVRTFRAGFNPEILDRENPDLVFLSPGPGSPRDFQLPELVLECVKRDLPIFGVCLGLQGIVEAFGGKLGQLPYPVHGKSSKVTVEGDGLFRSFPSSFEVGRYHSLYALDEELPDCFRISARSDDGIIMAIEHRSLPVAAVQFHPESIMSLRGDLGLQLIGQVLSQLTRREEPPLLIEPIGIGNVVSTNG